ncbi:hypothetical protein EW146_g3979 [Bondarzewia mesenterica]|uniref:Protein-S-isoprenylcysteine O-methyltransferase n=1 Tax=Bondarzewia mesenterica TaxID=1095465 RepID=A0A4S4LVZ0_9AGAM|nr:hypothetical protein EW146_g3979 [Bondarzewia mesenterica]
MSALRATLVVVEALCVQFATTPPNKSPNQGRYHTEEILILRAAPFIFALQQPLIWFCALLDILVLFPPDSIPLFSHIQFTPRLQSHSTRSPEVTPLFLLGFAAVLLGTVIRTTCFRALGHLFTFDLAVLEGHKLVTSGPYAYVRHPSYCGSLLLVFGLPLSQFTRGSCLVEGGLLDPRGVFIVLLWASWWIWAVAVAVRRAYAEDEEMKKQFGKEWEGYAARVRWWFFPGLM